MADPSTTILQQWINRLNAGDPEARGALLRHTEERLRLLCSRMLRHYPVVQRFEQTDDVVVKVQVRLDRMLGELAVPTVTDFLCLAARHIRHVLIDFARHYRRVPPVTPPNGSAPAPDPVSPSDDPARLALWAEFHEQIGRLPAQELAVFELLWYHGRTQKEAAELLGVATKTIQRHWYSARVRLVEALGGELPS
jgi:RNA polymerase sigma factor (sigma-70 family)